eukprot:1159045-Pelagomonas_calceolata.AAC.18
MQEGDRRKEEVGMLQVPTLHESAQLRLHVKHMRRITSRARHRSHPQPFTKYRMQKQALTGKAAPLNQTMGRMCRQAARNSGLGVRGHTSQRDTPVRRGSSKAAK